MDSRARLAWNVRRARTAIDLSQDALAHEANVGRTYVGGIERQEYNPSLEILDRLANALGIDIVELLVRPETKHPPAPLAKGRRPSKPTNFRAKRRGA